MAAFRRMMKEIDNLKTREWRPIDKRQVLLYIQAFVDRVNAPEEKVA
jgi:hypothetical protein